MEEKQKGYVVLGLIIGFFFLLFNVLNILKLIGLIVLCVFGYKYLLKKQDRDLVVQEVWGKIDQNKDGVPDFVEPFIEKSTN